jgi:hypothetical protein
MFRKNPLVLSAFSILFSCLVLISCTKKNDDPSPVGAEVNAQIRLKISDTTFSASKARLSNSDNLFRISASIAKLDTPFNFNPYTMDIYFKDSIGIYKLDSTPGYKAKVVVTRGNNVWAANKYHGGSGVIEVLKINNDSIKGTFLFTATPDAFSTTQYYVIADSGSFAIKR